MDSNRLAGRVAVVTGGGSGIGEAIVDLFAKEGAAVVVADIEGTAAAEASARHGGIAPIEPVALDVSDPDHVERAVGGIIDRHGRVDVLVNCAGYSRFTPIEEFSVTEWHRAIDVNLSGVFYCSVSVARHMMARRSGRIINIASLAGITGIPDQCGYVAAKHGVIGLTKALAIDLGPYGITVNCVCPATTLTPLALKTRSADFLREEPRHHPLGRLATPLDQARAVLFLASDEAGYLSGVVLPVDGGRVIAMRTRDTQI